MESSFDGKNVRNPNFIIGGAAASGTSFLSAAIIQHPQIYLPQQMRPEPHYFYKSWEYSKPYEYYLEKYFSGVHDEVAVGERSSSYLYLAEVPSRVAKFLPEVRWIFCLRNPIERAYANYRYTVLEGLEELSFDEALECEEERKQASTGIWAEIQPYDYTGRGFYGRQLANFFEYFPRENFFCIKSEQLRAEPHKEFARLFAFLGVDVSFAPTLPEVFNSPSVKDRKIQKLCRDYFQNRFDALVEHIRIVKNIPLLDTREDQHMAERLFNNLEDRQESLSSDTRGRLRNLYAEDMNMLISLVDFHVDDWQ